MIALKNALHDADQLDRTTLSYLSYSEVKQSTRQYSELMIQMENALTTSPYVPSCVLTDCSAKRLQTIRMVGK